jgi:hypothetical protein
MGLCAAVDVIDHPGRTQCLNTNHGIERAEIRPRGLALDPAQLVQRSCALHG